MEQIDKIIADTLLERPIGFNIGSKHLYLYPVTLGMSYLVAPFLKELNIDGDILQCNPHLELIRVASTHTENCCRIVALHTLQGKEALDNRLFNKRTSYIQKNLSIDDLTLLLEQCLTGSHVNSVMQHFKIDKELEDMKRAQDAQGGTSSLSFGGKSIYGSIISNLAEKYGWTLNYILWEISYDNIQLLLADSVKTVYLSDEERNKAGLYDKSKAFNGNDLKDWEKLQKTDWFKRAVESGDISIQPYNENNNA